MNLHEKKILASRSNLIKQWKDKEWWYCGVFDPELKIYFSFFFIRVNLTDHFSFILFDPSTNQQFRFDKNLYLDKHQEKGALSLNYNSHGLKIGFNGNESKGINFTFKNSEFDITLDMKPTTPGFTKFNNNFVYCYTLFHYFHVMTSGTIKTPVKTYRINNGLCYYDHCFGRVPGKSGWHWFAGQNEDVSISSLINYGPYSQKYTQILFRKCEENIALNRWIRLNEDVSFEYNPEDKIKGLWRITSPDMDLEVTPIMYANSNNKIPPFFPFLVNIVHDTYYAKASGSVRIDNHWVDVKGLYGVLEEHYGKW